MARPQTGQELSTLQLLLLKVVVSVELEQFVVMLYEMTGLSENELAKAEEAVVVELVAESDVVVVADGE